MSRKFKTHMHYSKVGHSYLARGELFEAGDGDLVIGADFVVVVGVSEGYGQQALFLQVGL